MDYNFEYTQEDEDQVQQAQKSEIYVWGSKTQPSLRSCFSLC